MPVWVVYGVAAVIVIAIIVGCCCWCNEACKSDGKVSPVDTRHNGVLAV